MAYERNWAFSFNNEHLMTSITPNDHTRWTLWSWKAMLKGELGGFTQGLWTIYSSCDSVSAGSNGDLVDRWGATYDSTKIVAGTGGAVRSWLCLKSPLMGGVNFYLILAHDGGNDGLASAYLCKTAPTGGTTTARPTSADEWSLMFLPATSWNDNVVVGGSVRSNMCLSSTGDFIFFDFQANKPSSPIAGPHLAAAAISPVGCHASDQFPLWSFGYYVAGSPGFHGTAMTGINSGCRARFGTNAAAFATLPTISTLTTASLMPDLLTGKHFALPAWVVINGSGAAGWHLRGRLPDVFVVAGTTNAQPVGRTIVDVNGNITHVVVGMLAIPANAVPGFFS